MYVLTVANLKGGAGKTAAATNLAALLADAGQRTVLVDLDWQADSTTSLGVAVGEEQPTIAEVLDSRAAFAEATVDLGGGLAVLPAAGDLVDATPVDRDRAHAALLEALSAGDAAGWDVAVLDTRPEQSALVIAALRLADVILSPLNAQDGNSVKNAGDLVDLVADVAEPTAELRLCLSRVTPPRKGWRRRRAERAVEAAARERWGSLVLDPEVPESTALHAATVGGGVVARARPDSLPSDAYRRLMRALLPLLTPES